MILRPASILLLCSLVLAAQETRRDVIVVTGSYEPIPLEEAERAIQSLDVKSQVLLSNNVVDFLKLDPALDVRQRAPGGVQADLSIRGSSFGQTLILLNGQRLNDVQTGHHNMDIPVPLETVERVEILRGSGSALYGSDAVGGVVNVVTSSPEASEIRLRSAVGNFGVNEEHISLTGVVDQLSQQLNVSRDFSSGFAPNRDYRNLGLSSITRWRGTNITMAASDKPFGADRFYGNFNSWERTKTWLAAAQQKLDQKTDVSFTFRRHTDLFVLYRDRPEIYTNRHVVEGYQGALRRREEFSTHTRLFYGAEYLADSIDSVNLGRHARNREAAYLSFDARALRRFSFTAGLRDEVHGSLRHELSPTAGGGVWLTQYLKIRVSVSHAVRLPTYTDLYYHDPANVGSPDLRPESAWGYDGGLDWNAGMRLRGDVTVFHRRERDVIDYVRHNPTDVWRATNFQRLQFTGTEASVRFRLGRAQLIDLRHTWLHGVQDLPTGIETKYVFNYATHSGVVSWQGSTHGVIARTRLGVLKRVQREPYGVWDIYIARSGGKLKPFLQLTNVTSTRYEEVPGVAMPSRAVVIGLECAVTKR